MLFVIAYHVRPYLFGGGLGGVDVFFVISGFLITGVIAQGLATGAFSLREFYARRVRRLLPALGLVLLFSLVAGWLLFGPEALNGLAAGTVASATMSNNWRLWLTMDYFGAPANFDPLMHLWSLGVEEQFYLLWPVSLIVLLRAKRPLAWISVVIGLSFALNLVQSVWYPAAAFYLPFARLWEPLLGSALWLMQRHTVASATTPRSQRLRDSLAAAGAFLVVLACIAQRDPAPWPGLKVLAPTLGATMIIAAGAESWVNRTLLANRLLVTVGLISYPLYLWHQPLLAFKRYASPTMPGWQRIAVLALAFVLAYLTYRLVELPIRRRGGARAVAWLIASQGVLIVAGGVIMSLEGAPGRFNERQQLLFAWQTRTMHPTAENSRQNCSLQRMERPSSLLPECVAEAPEVVQSSRVLLLGDSFAGHLLPGIQAVIDSRIAFRKLIAPGCKPVPVPEPELLLPTATTRFCAELNQFAMQFVHKFRPGTVILSADWGVAEELSTVEETVRRLQGSGVSRVVIVGSVAHFDVAVNVAAMQALAHGELPFRLPTHQLPALRRVDSTLRAIAARTGAILVTPLDVQCDVTTCLTALGPNVGQLTTWDNGHLTPAGSQFVVERLLRPYLKP